MSQSGPLEGNCLVQAKGHAYTLEALLDEAGGWAQLFRGGDFATLYLAPFNYHRIHMPLAGTLRAAWYVPGQLFSVNATTAASVPGLFTRNERLVCVFEHGALRFALVLVGALFVGSMSTVWHGDVTPRRPRRRATLPLESLAAPLTLAQGRGAGPLQHGLDRHPAAAPRGGRAGARRLRAAAAVRVGQTPGAAAMSDAGADWRPSATPARLTARARLLARARAFFAARQVLEVDTPLIVNAAVSDVHIHAAEVRARRRARPRPHFLHTSPEYAMKRLLAAGSGDIYQICHVARGFEAGRLHNPEFTLIEWYRLGFSLGALMDEVESLVRALLAEGAGARAQRAGELSRGVPALPRPRPLQRERAGAGARGGRGRLQRRRRAQPR